MIALQAICPERWEVVDGRLTHKGKVNIVEDAFEDQAAQFEAREARKEKQPAISKGAARMAAKLAARTPGNKSSPGSTPATSNAPTASNTPAGSGDEGANGAASPDASLPKAPKKKLTRKQLKEREERRRQRTLRFLSSSIPGTVREPDTDSD